MRVFLITLLFCYVSSKAQLPAVSLPGLSTFVVIEFPNIACNGTNRVGTCYTAEECAERDGTAEGQCADGFGVCCQTQIPCDGVSRENNSFMMMAQVNNPPNSVCSHKILPLNSNICRIRLDFTLFNIAGPVPGTVVAADGDPATTTGGAIGTCNRDTFSVSSPGNLATPIICGLNTGQHLFVDAVTAGNTATFTFNKDVVARSYDIRVIQFECGDTQGGPSDCLQYFTGPTGTVASFNFPLNTATVGATETHLVNQHYQVCFRRESGRCRICYIPSVTVEGTANNIPAKQSSFGLSVSGDPGPGDDPASSQTDPGNCMADYLTIPYAFSSDQALFANNIPVYDFGNGRGNDRPSDLKSRLCGRIFAANEEQEADDIYTGAASISVCTVARPFRVNVDFDSSEVQDPAAAGPPAAEGERNELALAPGGIIGFSLDFTQLNC